MWSISHCFKYLVIIGLFLLTKWVFALDVQMLDSPASEHSAQVHLSKGTDGTIVMSWLEHKEGEAILRYSTWQSPGWSMAQTVVSGDDWFVNWADFPSVSPISGGLWAAHWLHKKPGGTYAYDVAMSVSNDAGKTWSKPITPHKDGTPTEHGFVSLFPWNNGVGAIWLDGRNMPAEQDHDHQNNSVPTKSVAETGMTLRSAVITLDGEVTESQVADGLVCDCCQTDIAVLPAGPVAVYRNRTTSEIRDIQIVSAVDGQWQDPVLVSADDWNIAGCPVNGPAIAANGQQLAVAWFTGANDQPRVRMAYSNSDGGGFTEAVDIDSNQPQGRVDIELLDDGSAVVLWMCHLKQVANLCLRKVSATGEMGDTVRLDGVVKPGGFPHFTQANGDLLLAWVESADDGSRIKTAQLPLNKL